MSADLPGQVSSAALWYKHTRCALETKKLVQDLGVTDSTSDTVCMELKAVRVELHKVDEKIARVQDSINNVERALQVLFQREI
jgi:hypothetical protein